MKEQTQKHNYWQILRWVLGTVVVGAVVLETCELSRKNIKESPYSSLETRVGQTGEINDVNKSKPTDYQDLSYLNTYDSIIKEVVDYFNKKHNLKIDLADPAKAQIKREAGSLKERENSFKYDPMQISTAKKNCALEILANGEENTNLIGDFSILKGKKKPVWDEKNNCWDYSKTGMDAKSSIYGGVGWLLHKAAIYDTRVVEEGPATEYEIKKGDNFCKIAKENCSTTETLVKYNPGLDPTKLQIGQKIKFKKAKDETYIKGWKNLELAVEDYNGGGTPGYAEGVYKNLEEIAKTNKKIVVLDPGHGMGNQSNLYDPGAVYGEFKEAEIVLRQAKKIKQILESRGYEIYLTRDNSEENVPLSARAEIAKKLNADVFVSLHCNSSDSNSAYGQEVFYNEGGESIAQDIQIGLVNEIGNNSKFIVNDRGIKKRDLRVLNTNIPAVVVESGFLPNDNDRAYLTDGIDDVETGIANGIDNYFKNQNN
jgi:N-acetylmuramoyl-L-alanine amidase